MYSKIHYSIVGFFVLLFIGGLLMFAFWLAKFGFEKQYDDYYVYFRESVGGLTADSSVKLNGVNIGKISTIEIDKDDPQRIRVFVHILSGTPITEDMHATLKPQGITGLSYLEIMGGSKDSKRIKREPDTIPVIPAQISMFGHITQTADELFANFNSVLTKANELFSETNQKNFKAILNNGSVLTKKAIAIEEKLSQLIVELNTTTKATLEATGKDVTLLARDLRKTIRRGDYNFKRILRPVKVDIQEMVYQIQDLSTELKSLTRNPSRIIFDNTSQPKGPGE